MTSLQYFKGFSMLRTETISETADIILSMADKIDRDFGKGKVPFYNQSSEPLENGIVTEANYCSVVKKVKKDNITPENIGEIILCQIPGISYVSAIAIMKHFQGFPNLIDELKQNPSCLDNIIIETNGKTRKINKSSIENIRKYLIH
jgi:ERCC4-type nuclease